VEKNHYIMNISGNTWVDASPSESHQLSIVFQITKALLGSCVTPRKLVCRHDAAISRMQSNSTKSDYLPSDFAF